MEWWWNNTNGRIGIGTSAPDRRLQVTDGGSGDWIVKYTNGSVNTYFCHNGGYGMNINSATTANYAIQCYNGIKSHFTLYNNGTMYLQGPLYIFNQGGDANMGISFFGNNQDGVSYTNYNGGIESWSGIGFRCRTDAVTRHVWDCRAGNYSCTGQVSGNTIYAAAGMTINGDWYRVNGTGGIYWNTYAGGWYMSDSTYMRCQSDRTIYSGGGGGTGWGFQGNINGNCSGSSGSCTGNAATASYATNAGSCSGTANYANSAGTAASCSGTANYATSAGTAASCSGTANYANTAGSAAGISSGTSYYYTLNSPFSIYPWYTGWGGSTYQIGGFSCDLRVFDGPNYQSFIRIGASGSFGVGNGNSLNATNGTIYCGQIQVNAANVANGNVYIAGSLSKGSGTFDIEHPLKLKSDERLVHSFIEGPRCDLIYRGVIMLVDGTASVNIDTDCVASPDCAMSQGTFVALCTNPQLFLQSSTFDPVIGDINGNILLITCKNLTSTAKISWMVVAERNDPHIKLWKRTNSDGYLKTEYKIPEEVS